LTDQKATFGAGCFWGVEAAFRRLDGVSATRVGYAGGAVENPSYEQVCYDRTGHAEVVEVTYDEEKIAYEQLLAVFWAEHDPTQLNRQGPDVGDQYRSAIFTHDEAQRTAAEASRERVQARLSKPVVTQIEDAPPFWEAEDYHQRYLEKRGLASCTARLAS
jgi:peptide-methionine (S)-S-oxide reductase